MLIVALPPSAVGRRSVGSGNDRSYLLRYPPLGLDGVYP
jgi:hypothetical protein